MLNIDHVFFSYQKRLPYLLQDICLHVHAGDYISIVGDNGCGKSTLLRLMLGFLHPVHGSIHWQTRSIRYVAQKGDFSQAGFPITVREVLDSYCKLLHIQDKHAAVRVLEQVGMGSAAGQLIGTLSGGQAQKIAIARAMLGSPEVMLLDEPSTGIDRQSQQEIYRLLKTFNREQHLTILSVEHNLDAALANSTRIYHLTHGQGHLCSPKQYAAELFPAQTQEVSHVNL